MIKYLLAGLCLCALPLYANPSDSLRVSRLLEEVAELSSEQNKIIYLAKGFQNTPYLGGTLEAFPSERLVVRTDSVDCTTFVEYVVALYLTDKTGERTYQGFKKQLQYLRYRQGKIDGYVSRLHYFSDWIRDAEKKGILQEVTDRSPHEFRKVSLNFMTTHAGLYPALAHDEEAVADLQAVEKAWVDYSMPYIPKRLLGSSQSVLNIHDGDVLALATSINGLDVVHVGFAVWVEGRLHLLHASSSKRKVLLDPVKLVDYSKRIKSHIGVRVLRLSL